MTIKYWTQKAWYNKREKTVINTLGKCGTKSPTILFILDKVVHLLCLSTIVGIELLSIDNVGVGKKNNNPILCHNSWRTSNRPNTFEINAMPLLIICTKDNSVVVRWYWYLRHLIELQNFKFIQQVFSKHFCQGLLYHEQGDV